MHGTAEATEHLKQHCLKNVCPHVYAPQIEETIDVTSDLCAYKVGYSRDSSFPFQVVISYIEANKISDS